MHDLLYWIVQHSFWFLSKLLPLSLLSCSTIVLYSRDRYEIIGLRKSSHSIKQSCSSICLEKAFAIP